ncbi:drug/metabolite transporter (DMT)-like permease [Hydrogenophaga palleronii]|uniref:Drug/metabolite transporter (DMT)-like permease n=1 Tax=Hydrogenophaga palleronii TaxID=65655 RepID=A0ABU1WV42_9BURK|nr:DMT family transporter [Hydrogenophaga palleronii]MDR7152934.1 drug/metabolite transporter (DMT)-like permease [Hydrogenophaga palleronii]
MTANLLALGAIVLWATLAALGVSLSHVPAFLLTGLALIAGSLIALPLSRFDLRQWRVPLPTLALGIYGLFGFHFLLFIALRHAPPVQANLVNYLWPLGIVVMAPLFLPDVSLTARHVIAALTGFAGAVLAILGWRADASAGAVWAWGYLPALGSAFIWASYSLMTQRVRRFPTAAIGSFALASGLLSLLCHAWLEPTITLSARDGFLIALLGLGPLGGAFFLWDAALKRGDARQIGVLSFLTPLLSTLTLLWMREETPSASVALGAVMIIVAAMVATFKGRPAPA